MDDRDLVKAQAQVIGLLMEVIKKMQANSDLDAEYMTLAASGRDPDRMQAILSERRSNAESIQKILSELDA